LLGWRGGGIVEDVGGGCDKMMVIVMAMVVIVAYAHPRYDRNDEIVLR